MVKDALNIAMASHIQYLQSTYPKLKNTEFARKYKSEESTGCLPCIKMLFYTTTRIFTFTNSVYGEMETAKSAMQAFDIGWDPFVKCWKETATVPASKTELMELKLTFSSGLKKFIDNSIKSQDKVYELFLKAH